VKKNLRGKDNAVSCLSQDATASTVLIPNSIRCGPKERRREMLLESRGGTFQSSKKQITIEEVMHRKKVQSRSVILKCREVGELTLNNERCWLIYEQGSLFMIHPQRWKELCMQRFSKPYSLFSADLFQAISGSNPNPTCKHGHSVWIQIL
jgi:hypothetical protein